MTNDKIHFVCPAGHWMEAERVAVGQRLSCLVCRQSTIVPARSAAKAPVSLAQNKSRPAVEQKKVGPPPLPPQSPLSPPRSLSPQRQPRTSDATNTIPSSAQPAPPIDAEPPPRRLGIQRLRKCGSGHRPVEPARRRGYRPDAGKRTSVRWVGAVLALITFAGMYPLRETTSLTEAPAWAQCLLLLSVLQLAYVGWLVTLPDWSTVRVLMVVYSSAAAIYGFLLAVVLFTPVDRPLLLMLESVRATVGIWCGIMLLTTFLGAMICGRFSHSWRKSYLLAAAG
ncbi:MAG: hypothetical protein N2C12_07260 [Planctomycetales bacterium]